MKNKNGIWFCGKNIAESLGYKYSSSAISKHCKENFIICNAPTKGGNQDMKFISENCVVRLIQKAKTLSEEYKYEFHKWLFSLDLIKEKVVIESRKEIEFVKDLGNFLEGFGVKNGITQYKVLDYRIDYYIPDFKIAIEYDENDHIGYSYEAQELRQKRIEEELKCKFIRLSDSNSNTYNIGMIAKELIA